MSEWEPIKTAPKDGTIILIASKGDTYTGWWANGTWCFLDNTAECVTGCCDREAEGRVEYNSFIAEGYVTHWMPLPEAPQF